MTRPNPRNKPHIVRTKGRWVIRMVSGEAYILPRDWNPLPY